MSKTRNKNANTSPQKSSYSTGSRGDSAFSRNQSGNHHGNRHRANRSTSSGK